MTDIQLSELKNKLKNVKDNGSHTFPRFSIEDDKIVTSYWGEILRREIARSEENVKYNDQISRENLGKTKKTVAFKKQYQWSGNSFGLQEIEYDYEG